MLKIIKAIGYYLASIPTLLTGLEFWKIPWLVLQKPILIKVNNQQSFFVESLMDIWTIKEVIMDKNYEYAYKIKKNDVIVDVGASIGDFSINSAKLANKVFAFEMNKHRVQLMEKNITFNKSKNIVLKNWQIASLDKIFKLFKIPACNLLKIDCEGAEYRIFRNTSPATLAKIRNIAMEAHLFDAKMLKNYSELKQRLTKLNYKIIELDNPVHDYLKYFYAQRHK